jgi:hypothetical protein
MTTGDAALNLAAGTVLTPGQSAASNSEAIGTGIPSKPVIVMSTSGSIAASWAVTGTTDQQITNTQLPNVNLKQLVGWREVF